LPERSEDWLSKLFAWVLVRFRPGTVEGASQRGDFRWRKGEES